MDRDRWAQLRALFDAVCDLPRGQWQSRLAELSADDSIVEEVLLLLRAQTMGLSRVRNQLDTAIAHALAPEFDVGQRLGPWRLVERIAHGGMGTVFLAERADGAYQRTVAIKLLHGLPGPAESERLGFERQLLASLQLPNIARLYDGGSTPEGHPYLVMEYVPGLALDRYCERHKPSLGKRLELFLEICRTVQAAHQHLVLHCDLKPGNVLIRDTGCPVLLDFGVARMLNESHERRSSGFCTPAYASPELMRGDAVGVASDVYSLGVMLVELLSASACRREWQDGSAPVPLPSVNAAAGLKWRRELRGDLDAIAAKACNPDALQRYRSVGALIADLRRYLGNEPVAARGGGRLYRSRRALRRHWRSLLAMCGALVLVAVFVINLFEARRQAEEDAAIARQVSRFLVGAFESADPRRRAGQGGEELTARQLLDSAASRVSRDLAEAPAQLARMRAVLGLAYQNLGVPQRAEQLLREAVDGLLDARTGRTLDAAAVLADLSIQKSRGGEGAQGLQLAQQALQLVGRERAPQLKAKLHHARGVARVSLQRFEQGEHDLSAALEFLSGLPASEAAEGRYDIRFDMGLMYSRWGKPRQAEWHFRALLQEIQQRDGGLRHAVEVRLAQVLREQGRFSEALPLLQRGLDYAIAVYGAESSFVLLQHEALADLYQDSGDYRAAERHYLSAAALGERIHGRRSVPQSMILFNHATLKEARGDIDAAEALYRSALDIRHERLGVDSPTSLRAEVGLGQLLLGKGQLQEAGDLLMHADAGLSRMLPVDAPGRLDARLARVQWNIACGDIETAAQALATIDVDQAAMPYRIMFYDTQALLFQHSGQGASELAARRNVLQLARSLYGQESPNAASRSVGLAETLLRFNHVELALAELQVAVPLLRRHMLAESAALRKAEGLLLLSRAGSHPRDPVRDGRDL